MRRDNFARGELLQVVQVRVEAKPTWTKYSADVRNLTCHIQEEHPPEYWGENWDESYPGTKDFIAATNQYPWLPGPISTLGM